MVFIPLLLLCLVIFSASGLKPGNIFEIECPKESNYTVINVRTYAVVMTNAQRNMEFDLFYEPSETESQEVCKLSKDNQVCLIDGFVSKFRLRCEKEGTGSFRLIKPVMATQIEKDEPLRERALVPFLPEGQRGVVTFQPLIKLEKSRLTLDDIFISNCIEVSSYFQGAILIGVKGKRKKCMVMLDDSFSGEWSFQPTIKNLKPHAPVEAYLKPEEEIEFQVREKVSHGVRVILKTENESIISNLSINMSASYNDGSNRITRNIEIVPEDLKGKIPIKLSFFFQEHPIEIISLKSSMALHFILEALFHEEAEFVPDDVSEGSGEVETPLIEQDEQLVYVFEKLGPSVMEIKAHIRKSYISNATPLLRVVSSNGKVSSGKYKRGDKWEELSIANNQIRPVSINNSLPFVEFLFSFQIVSPMELPALPQNGPQHLEKEPDLEVHDQRNIFKILLESSFEMQRIHIGESVVDFLFENEIKRYYLSQDEMKGITDKKLYLSCEGCYVYATYQPLCLHIDCSEYSHAELIDTRPDRLVIMITAATHQEDTALIRLQVSRGEDKVRMQSGEILEGILTSEVTYLFKSEIPDDDVEIICNSPPHSILMLANLKKDTFPTKHDSEYQSNEGYLHLPLSNLQTIFIKLIPMNLNSSRISYSLVVASKSSPIRLMEGKALQRDLSVESQHKYQLEHPCHTNERIFLRVNSKQALLPTIILFQPDVASEEQQIRRNSSSTTIDISNYFQVRNDEKLCSLSVSLLNSGSDRKQTTIMFFKESQREEIFTANFYVFEMLSGNPLMLFCVVDPSQPVTVYAYSGAQEIQMQVRKILVRSIKELNDEKSMSSRSFPTPNGVDATQASFSQYQFLAGSSTNDNDSKQSTVILISLSFAQPKGFDFERLKVTVICTQGHTRMGSGNRLYYRLKQNEGHRFEYLISEKALQQIRNKTAGHKSSSGRDQIVFQTSQLTGKLNLTVNIMLQQKILTTLSTTEQSHDGSLFILRGKKILEALEKSNIPFSEIDSSLMLTYSAGCLPVGKQGGCEFLSSLHGSSSEVREIIPGWPQAFHIAKQRSMVFVYNNGYDDRAFKFKINRKLGFPNYQICSSELSKEQRGGVDCLASLEPRNDVALFQDNIYKVDKSLVLGRSHELIINQFSEHYCTSCTYYLALYSGYELVEGSLFVMSAKEPTVIESGNSITTIVYRNEPDHYLVVSSSLMAILYQVEGRVGIEIGVDGEDYQAYEFGESGEIVTISFKDMGGKKYYLRVKPEGNSPSCLYTLVLVEALEQKISLKDGVPYEMDYEKSEGLSSIIKYDYICQNDGLVMLSTKKFHDLTLSMLCLDNAKQLQVPSKSSILANRLDITISPLICNHYQFTLQVLTPNVLYTILVSVDDVITLPLGRELPGVLKYQSKLFQVYEIQVKQKSKLQCTIKFCQGGDGEIMVAKNKEGLQEEVYEQQLIINEGTSFQSFLYDARPGVFYIKIEFKDRGGVLEYTIHADTAKKVGERQKISILNNKSEVDFKVLRVNNQYTEFEIGFWPLMLDLAQYEVGYYIMESNEVDLLHQTENCNGQYFAETVNHHQSVSVQKIRLAGDTPEANKIFFLYKTTSPYNFVTIVPMIYHRSTRAYYHLYVPKYTAVKLKNGQVFSRISFLLGDFIQWVEQYMNIHDQEKAVLACLLLVGLCACVGVLVGGVWVGRRCFFETRTVYVMRNINQEESQLEEESATNLQIN